MDLLNQIIRQPVDPDYAAVAARPGPPRRSRIAFAVVSLLIGALFAVAALQTTRSAPDIARERTELIARIKAAQQNQDALRDRAGALAAENARLRLAGLGDDAEARSLERQLDTLEPEVGTTAVSGPGLVITVDDGPGTDSKAQVLDTDLQIMVNGLWASGAEAITVNDQRLTSVSAIRTAGQAITVNYRSLSPPYTVRAIGDLRTLQARFVQSSGGTWWNALEVNEGMRYDIQSSEQLELPGDPGLVLHYAKKAGS